MAEHASKQRTVIRRLTAVGATLAMTVAGLTALIGWEAQPDRRVGVAQEECDLNGDGSGGGVIIDGVCTEPDDGTGDSGEPLDGEVDVVTNISACNEPPGTYEYAGEVHEPGDGLSPVDGWDCSGRYMDCDEGTNYRWQWTRTDTWDNGTLVEEGIWRHTDRVCAEDPEPSPEQVREAVLSLLPKAEPGINPAQGRTLVNFVTYFYATGAERGTVPVEVVGQQVTVEYWPENFRWNFGDGDTHETPEAGAPYPNATVQHIYNNAEALDVDVDVQYGARFQVAGGNWRPIPGGVTVENGPPVDLEIIEGASRLGD